MSTDRPSLILSSILLFTLTACPPSDGDTTRAETTPETSTNPVTSIDPSLATEATSQDSTEATSTGIPTTSATDDTSDSGTTMHVPMGGPCDGIPDDPACMCEGTDDAFCAALDAFCREEAHLDLSNMNPPGTDYCDSIASWCATPNVGTYSACYLLESTCDQVVPTGNLKDCDGLRDACACDDFVLGGDTTGGTTGTTGAAEEGDTDTTGGEDVAPAIEPGQPGGPCDAEGTCAGVQPNGAPNECRKSEAGQVCLEACAVDDECGNGASCWDSFCAWPCFNADDCPFLGMACAKDNPNMIGTQICVWVTPTP